MCRIFLAFLLLHCVAGHFPVAAAEMENIQVRRIGTMPKQGRLVVRSALAWLNETSPTFLPLGRELSQLLTTKGFTVVSVKPSALDPMPHTPLPSGNMPAITQSRRGGVRNLSQAKGTGSLEGDAGEQAAQERAVGLAREGKLPQVSLRSYATPKKDAGLPPSVLAIVPPDVELGLYALSQTQGAPRVRFLTIPGRMPRELTGDAGVAEFALVVRFAEVSAMPEASRKLRKGEGDAFSRGVLLAASGVGGVGSLGFGPPASHSAQQRGSYGSQSGFHRGFEGSAPNDFWNRDHDFYQRDYQFKYGTPPLYAEPPKGAASTASPPPLPSAQGPGSFPAGRMVRDAGLGMAVHHLLLFDLYDLSFVWSGGKPKPVWWGSARCPGDEPLAQTLPVLARAIFAE